jgi:predicted phage-related endonuclease
MSFKLVEPKDDEAWLELRRKVLTASDIGVILGLNKWKSIAELLDAKENPKFFENSYTWLGQTLEPVVVTATNKALNSSYYLFEDDTRSFFLDETIGLGATPDATDGETLLECKSTKPGNFLRWAEWPPAYYISQLYTQLICTGKSKGYLAIMSTNMSQKSEELKLPLHVFELLRTEELDAILLSEVKRFWDTQNSGKTYRVSRKNAPGIELKFRFATRKVYGR